MSLTITPDSLGMPAVGSYYILTNNLLSLSV